jgi:hypothetical protein
MRHASWNKIKYKRTSGSRDVRQKLLILTEGKSTEPNYFKGFRCRTADIVIKGTGEGKVSLVEFAIKERDRRLNEGDEYDQTWCVFDRDKLKNDGFEKSLKLAKDNSIKVAYSNPCFELWYVLHFEYLHTALEVKHYLQKLNKLLGKDYEKNAGNLYEVLLPNQSKAIKHSSKLLNTYTKHNPEKNNPSTDVHLLVEEINKYL